MKCILLVTYTFLDLIYAQKTEHIKMIILLKWTSYPCVPEITKTMISQHKYRITGSNKIILKFCNYQFNETKQINCCFICNELLLCTVFHQSICFNPSNGTVGNIISLMFTFQPQHVSP